MIRAGANVATDAENARTALAELCRTYWRPVFVFACRRGFSPEDAQDLTQDFFSMILETNWLRHADQTRGRFRSLLLCSLQRFLLDAGSKRDALKRGGGVKFVSWDEWRADGRSHLAMSPHALETLPAEHLFDVRWAATVVEQALQRLSEECERKGRLRLFEALNGHLVASGRPDGACAVAAKRLGLSESAIKTQLHNLRQRYRWLLRDEVARTVSDPMDIDDEIRHLCATLADGT